VVRTPVTGIVLASAMSCALIACSAEAGPQATPSPTTPTTPWPTTPSVTTATAKPTGPVEPELPKAAEASNRAGAEAFVRYYIALINFAGSTGHTTELKRHSSGCSSCDNLASAFQETYERGGHYDSRGWRIYSQFTVREPSGTWVSLLEVQQTPMTWVEKAGAEPKKLPPKRLNLRFELERLRHHGWSVSRLTET
jgi:hypothetical protein